jgi:polysaccharide biosynthesis protein PslH
MARVLYLTQVLPYPLNTGARVRQYYTLRHLSRQHDVTLVSFVRADDRPEHVAHLKTFCADVQTVPMVRSRWRDGRAVIKGLLTAEPFVIARDEIGSMQQLIARLHATNRFEVIHADQVSMAQYGLIGRTLQARRVLDLHNALYLVTRRLADHEPQLIRRLIARRETGALAKYEAKLCTQYDHVVFVTDEDRRAIQSQILNLKSQIVTTQPSLRGTKQSPPIGPEIASHALSAKRGRAWRTALAMTQAEQLPPISNLQPATSKFHTIPICIDPAEKQPVTPVAQPFRVTALGLMFWPPNAEGVAWFAREAWSQVRAQFPAARLTIVGKNPPPALLALNGRDQIEVTGYVPDLDRVLAETAVFIVPLRAGGGMRVKILDAWCWGLPIVSTTIGAEGIHIRSGENILIADRAEDFGQAVRRVLGDSELANNLRRSGRRWVEEQYDWRTVYAAWDEIYSGLND